MVREERILKSCIPVLVIIETDRRSRFNDTEYVFACLLSRLCSSLVYGSPAIGFNVETVSYKNINFQVWDLGGESGIGECEKSIGAHATGLSCDRSIEYSVSRRQESGGCRDVLRGMIMSERLIIMVRAGRIGDATMQTRK